MTGQYIINVHGVYLWVSDDNLFSHLDVERMERYGCSFHKTEADMIEALGVRAKSLGYELFQPIEGTYFEIKWDHHGNNHSLVYVCPRLGETYAELDEDEHIEDWIIQWEL